MPEFKAKCVYDFEPQAGSCEVALRCGEVVRVVRCDVGDGWWEGYNASNQCGLFPEAYVERMDAQPPMPPPAPPVPPAAPPLPPASLTSSFSAPPSHPPPVLPATNPPSSSGRGWNTVDNSTATTTTDPNDPWNLPQPPRAPSIGSPVNHSSKTSTVSDDWDDDDWDDSDADTVADEPTFVVSGRSGKAGSAASATAGQRPEQRATIRRNLNRFSTFVKSGGEDYILGVTKMTISDADKIKVIETERGYEWDAFAPYTCTVTSPKKESKLKGLKSFIVYQLVPSFSSIQVSRRYKHFDWLHERLEEKFILVPVAPLPDKQVTGRYEENFIEHRMLMLQQWVNRICRHPVLSRCEVWNHFVTCTDEKRWKTGKRRAERDELVGANFFFSLSVPDKPLPPGRIETEIDQFSKFSQQMDLAVKNLQTTALEEIKRYQGSVKRRYCKMAHSFKTLSAAFLTDSHSYCPSLTQAVSHTADTYSSLGVLCEQQPKYDWERFSDLLHEYRGMLTSFPEMLTIHKGSMQKRREYERCGGEGRLDSSTVQLVCQRTDVVSYALMAEMSHFQNERVADFSEAMRGFLRNQVSFYRQIADKLEASLQMYQDI